MGIISKTLRRTPRDPLCWRVRRDKVGKLFFKRFQAGHELVVFEIANHRVAVDVITLVVVANLVPEPSNLARGRISVHFGGSHRFKFRQECGSLIELVLYYIENLCAARADIW